MAFVLLDWTRMGKGYCLAGAVLEGEGARIVRPLSITHQRSVVGGGGLFAMIRSFFVRDPPEGDRTVGWPAFLMAGRSRWEEFDLVSPRLAKTESPHVEDTWVRSLRPCKRLATPDQRRAILRATAAATADALFGAPLRIEGTKTFLLPGEGQRSLSTLLAPAEQIQFHVGQRDRHSREPRIRVNLPFPGLGVRTLPVTDHHLYCRVEQQASRLEDQAELFNGLIRQMGEIVAVRLGLSRPFGSEEQSAACWLMANGFFSLADPQP